MLVTVASSSVAPVHRTAPLASGLYLLNRKEEDICGDTARLSIKYAECSSAVLNIPIYIYRIQM